MKLKRTAFAFYVSVLMATTLLAQKMTPEQVIQKQLETYNNKDIDGFMSLIDDHVTFHDFSDGSITMKGSDTCKEFYGTLFNASPNLHSTILTSTVFGNKVIDYESIEGRNGNDELL